jgi:hypothetical protein
LTTLFAKAFIRYDPANYHGPDLYYFALVFSKFFGCKHFERSRERSDFRRFDRPQLAFFLRNYIGRIGALARRFSRRLAGNGLHFALFYTRDSVRFF